MSSDNRQYDCLDSILQEYYEKYVQMKDEKKKVIVKNLQQVTRYFLISFKNILRLGR